MPALVTLTERIAAASAQLTPTERRIAEIVLDDSTLVAFGTVAEVAERVSTSGPSVVRFATKLGFDGYGALQDEAQRSLSEQLKRPKDRIRRRGGGEARRRIRSTASTIVEAAFESVPPETVKRVADLLAAAPGNVWIVSSEGSAAALVLATGLKLLRPGARRLTGSPSVIGAKLADAVEADIAVVIDFSRYESTVVRTAELLADIGVTLIAITDSAYSPIAATAAICCKIDVPAIGPFDSALPPVAIAEALLAEVAHILAAEATTRLDRAEALAEAENVFFGEEA